jgi:hypothetical protein
MTDEVVARPFTESAFWAATRLPVRKLHNVLVRLFYRARKNALIRREEN